MSEYILEMLHCHKEFPGVVALDDVTLRLKRGEVHALMGENGAGKSTIMKILAGIYTLDSGEMIFDGKPFHPKNPIDSLHKGISMIHQELSTFPDMTIEQNMFVGREETGPLGVVKKKELVAKAQKYFDDMGIKIDVKKKLRTLTVAQMQMVEIVKATTFGADVIIMDEPTSAITDNEVDKLFEIIARLKNDNKAIVYISHKMDEIFRIADTITVLRDGKFIDCKPASELDNDKLVSLMVGRELTDVFVKTAQSTGDYDPNEVVLEVEGLTRHHEFEDVSFNLKKGEILGIYGLMGAGRTEMMETIFGLRKPERGKVMLHGQNKRINSPEKAIKNGIAFISEDRKLYGLNLIGSVKSNVTLAYLNLITKAGIIIDKGKEKRSVGKYIDALRIKTPSHETKAGSLSGGNQQKVVVAKWLFGEPDILIMDEPTRGIDIGAKAEIYKIMDDLAKRGKAIIMISSEMPELIGMSDRVVVLSGGKKTGEFTKEECDQETLLACAIKGL